MAAPVTFAILIVVAILGVAVAAWVLIPAFQGREAALRVLGSHRLEFGAWLSVIVLNAVVTLPLAPFLHIEQGLTTGTFVIAALSTDIPMLLIVYVRLMGEPNGHWNAYAPYNADGSYRGDQNSPHFYIEAWRRTVMILRGGPVWWINRHLRRLGLPPLKRRIAGAADLPHPRLAFLWVPQDAGSPDIPANSPGAFWPGSAYVDWVGTDFYSKFPSFNGLTSYYNQFPGKPFVFGEWALWGADSPGFVRTFIHWVLHHRRVRMLIYNQGLQPTSQLRLALYPRAADELRVMLNSPRFPDYAPEWASSAG